MFTHILKIQFVRQLLGAVGGALIAYAAYSGYRGAHDAVRAYLIAPEVPEVAQVQEEPVVDTSMQPNSDELELLAVRAPENESYTFVAQASSMSAETRVADIASTSDELHAGAPSLPASGIGLWIAAFAALVISFACTRRLRMLLHRAPVRVD